MNLNMQAMMKQAQKLQKEMMNAKNEIDNKTYVGKSSFVTAEVKGNKELLSINIDSQQLEKEDIEMLQDMIVIAVNQAMSEIDKDVESKLGKYTQGMPGLF